MKIVHPVCLKARKICELSNQETLSVEDCGAWKRASNEAETVFIRSELSRYRLDNSWKKQGRCPKVSKNVLKTASLRGFASEIEYMSMRSKLTLGRRAGVGGDRSLNAVQKLMKTRNISLFCKKLGYWISSRFYPTLPFKLSVKGLPVSKEAMHIFFLTRTWFSIPV